MFIKLLKQSKPVWILWGVILLFFGRQLVPWDGRFLGGFDVSQLFYWLAAFTKEQCLAGSLPLWNPHYYAGHPLIGLPSLALFYPSSILFVFLPLPWAFNLDFVAHLFAAGYGMYRLVMLLTGRHTAGVVSALAYMFSGYFFARLEAGHLTQIHSAALLPWVAYLLERALETRRLGNYAWCGVALGLLLLAGEPQNSFYTLLYVGVYGIIRGAMQLQGKPGIAAKVGLRLSLVAVVAFGLAAVQLVPAFEFAGLSDRAARSYEFSTFLSFPTANFLTLLLPELQASKVELAWEYAGYAGCMPWLLAALAIASPAHRQRMLPFLALGMVAVTLMLGDNCLLYRLYYAVIPGVGMFRVPARALVILVLVVAVLAGLGVDALLRGSFPARRLWGVLAGWGVVMVAVPWLVAQAGGAALAAAVWPAMVFMGCTALVVWLLARPSCAWAGYLAPALLFGDLFYYHHAKISQLDDREFRARRPYEALFAQAGHAYRVLSSVDINRGMLHSYANINAYSPIAIGNYFNFLHDMAGMDKQAFIRHRLPNDYATEKLAFSSRILGVKYALVAAAPGNFKLVADEHPMPRAALLFRAREVRTYAQQIACLRDPAFDPQKEVLLESPLPLPAVPGSGQAEVTEYRPNRIAVRTRADQPACLVLSELFYPGWIATIDGTEAPILKADCVLRAVGLPAGSHEVVFEYRPRSFRLGAAISAVTLLVLVCLRLRRRAQAGAGEHPPQMSPTIPAAGRSE